MTVCVLVLEIKQESYLMKYMRCTGLCLLLVLMLAPRIFVWFLWLSLIWIQNLRGTDLFLTRLLSISLVKQNLSIALQVKAGSDV